jgi:hypothetical protein
MRYNHRYILLFLVCAAAACSKDNYKAPASILKGRLMYKGDSIGVERNQVPLQLYQYGFGKVGAINGNFSQEGLYSFSLFDGDYKLIIPNGQGPFLWKKLANGDPDSLSVTLKGDQTLDLEVTPYYMLRGAAFTGGGGAVTANFSVVKVIDDPAVAKDVERVTLYINKTQFVSDADNIGKTDLAGADITDPDHVSLNVTVPDTYPAQNYVYARVGLKIAGVEDMIFSSVTKVQF